MNDNIQGGKVSEVVKSYLNRAFHTNQRLNDSLQNLEELRAKAYSIGAVDTTKDKIQAGRVSDTIGNSVPAIVDLENQINAEIKEYTEKRQEIKTSIERVSDEKFVTILLKRYVYFKSWEEIAVDMGYTYRHTTRLHGDALQAFEGIFKIYVLECPMKDVV